jgi:hypothetical protein
VESNIKMDIREIEWGGMDWINLVQDTDKLRALVNTLIFGFHKMLGNSWVVAQLAAAQEELNSMDLVSWLVATYQPDSWLSERKTRWLG